MYLNVYCPYHFWFQSTFMYTIYLIHVPQCVCDYSPYHFWFQSAFMYTIIITPRGILSLPFPYKGESSVR